MIHYDIITEEEIASIQSIVESAGCLFTSFSFLGERQYRVETYRYNDDITFYVLLDRNFVSEFIQIVNIIMNNLGRQYIPLSKEQRIIAAHQAFFQLCNIYCEPNIALYEYADQHDHENVLEELLNPHSAGYLRQKIILARRRAKKLQNQILFVSELNRRLNPIDKDKMNRVKTLKNPP